MRLRAQGCWWAAAAVSGAAVAVGPSAAQAQGFGLNEIGSCAIARGFATTGAPCEDASTLYWNPAAATMLKGLSVYGGATAIKVDGSFAQDLSNRKFKGDVPIEVPPFLGANYRFGRLALGVAAYVPYGLTSQWGQDFVGRFSAQKAALQSIYVQPNVAFEIVPGRLSIGGGPTLDWSQIELRQSIDLAGQTAQRVGNVNIPFAQLGVAPLTEFGRVQVKGSATGVGFNVGVHARPTSTISLGARYLSKVKFSYNDADATFEQVPTGLNIYPGSPLRASLPAGTPATTVVPLDAVLATQFTAAGANGTPGLLRPGQTANSELTFPAQLQVGVGFTGIPNTTISVDYALVEWSAFDELPVDFGATSPLTRVLREDYENSSSVRAGIEHRFVSAPEGNRLNGVAARAGFSYAQGAAPDVTVTPLLPDMNRYNFMAGLGIPLGRTLTLDAAFMRVETKGRRGRVAERTDESLSADQINTGFYGLSANIFSLSLKAGF